MFKVWDKNQDGILELEDFLEFWKCNVMEREIVVRQNLLTFGYRFDLKQNPVDGADDYILQVMPY